MEITDIHRGRTICVAQSSTQAHEPVRLRSGPDTKATKVTKFVNKSFVFFVFFVRDPQIHVAVWNDRNPR